MDRLTYPFFIFTQQIGADTCVNKVNAILNHPRYMASMAKLRELEKTRIFCKHDLDHSLHVARIMTLKVLDDHIGLDREVIYATALLHDLGRSLAYENGLDHESQSVYLAKEILPDCFFTPEEIEQILIAIAGHNDPDNVVPLTTLLKYADKMSRNCFCCPATDDCYWPERKKNKGVLI